ncbi:MAG: Gfo/Idh/MocA family oxidoreductase [Lentisphaerae bacterium]|nr:Gfo/Idh/MocA family oxidoreductase [Lentisphaerota bacterium]
MAHVIRAVMVGCGGITNAWLNAAKLDPELRIVGLVDLDLERARARASEFGLAGAKTGADLGRMLRTVKPDVVFDCTVPDAHCKVACKALAAGCHVLGEKPLADSMRHARKSIAAAEKAGRLYVITQNYRYNRNIRALARFLAEGNIGPVTTVCADFFFGAHFGGFRDRMKHVLLADMGIHTFDMGRLLTGQNPVAVFCHEWNPSGSWYEHDSSAHAIFEMTNNVVFTYRGSWCAEGLGTGWNCHWRIVGERGSVTWDGAEGFHAQAVSEPGGFMSKTKDLTVSLDGIPDAKTGAHAGVMAEFLRCIRDGGTPETVCTDNIHSLAMVFGAIESAGKRRRVAITA